MTIEILREAERALGSAWAAMGDHLNCRSLQREKGETPTGLVEAYAQKVQTETGEAREKLARILGDPGVGEVRGARAGFQELREVSGRTVDFLSDRVRFPEGDPADAIAVALDDALGRVAHLEEEPEAVRDEVLGLKVKMIASQDRERNLIRDNSAMIHTLHRIRAKALTAMGLTGKGTVALDDRPAIGLGTGTEAAVDLLVARFSGLAYLRNPYERLEALGRMLLATKKIDVGSWEAALEELDVKVEAEATTERKGGSQAPAEGK